MHDWIELPFKDIIKNGNVSYGIVQPGSNDVSENSIPILRINNFKNRRLVINDIFYVHKDIECKYARTRLNGSELLITVVGTIGQCIVAPQKLKGWNVARAIAVAQVKDNFDKYFIASQFEDEYIKFQIYGSMNDTVQPTLNLKELKEIKFRIPPFAEQRAIAGVLGSLDDKIDLLQRQNSTLEAMAETLFRQWFIEEAQEDWEKKHVSCIASCRKDNIKPQNTPNKVFYHYSIPAYDNYKSPEVCYGYEILSNKYIVSNGRILVSKLNPQFPRIWMLSSGVNRNSISSTEFVSIVPHKCDILCFIYCLLSSKNVTQQLANAASGTSGSHQRIRPEDILAVTFSTPSFDYMENFSKLVGPYFEKIHANQKQIRTLEKLRDTLLPKLMSGEVRVRVDR